MLSRRPKKHMLVREHLMRMLKQQIHVVFFPLDYIECDETYLLLIWITGAKTTTTNINYSLRFHKRIKGISWHLSLTVQFTWSTEAPLKCCSNKCSEDISQENEGRLYYTYDKWLKRKRPTNKLTTTKKTFNWTNGNAEQNNPKYN